MSGAILAIGFTAPLPVIVLGLVTGSTYGILAAGLVLIYRTNRIINFAQGQVGAFGAAVLSVVVTSYGVPYWVAFPIAIVISALAAVLVEVGVVRRLRNVPRLMGIIATLGFGQVLLFLGLVLTGGNSTGTGFPQPAGLPSFTIDKLVVTPAYSGMIIVVPIAVAALAVFLRFTRF